MDRKILVVDDDAMNLRMAEFFLQQNQYNVIKAESGIKCLDILNSQEVDLILLDVEMPMMNGIQTLEKIRENKKWSDIPVIFLTASVDSDTIMAADRLKAIDYLKKPFLSEKLIECVQKAIG